MSQLSSSSSSGGVIKKIKKKLSGATMGMRFMQRSSHNKNSSNSNHNHKISSSSASVDAIAKDEKLDEKLNVKNNDNNNNNGEHDNSYQWEMNNTKQQEQNQEQKEELLSSSTTTASSSLFLFETASQSDMYGIRSEIIGRRSFNNFNKAVEETYQAAVYSRRQQKLDKKMSREQISDEELLNRYEQYVKGRGDMSGGSGYGGKGKVVNDIGNLKKKRKR